MKTIEELSLLSPDEIESAIQFDEEQEMINHHIRGVTDWANQSNTSTYIFFCDPDFADRIKAALEVDYIVNVSYSTYMYFTNAEFTVQKRSH